MKLTQLKFKKLGNHWYFDIPHENPFDIRVDKRLEKYFNIKDKWNSGIIDNIYLIEETGLIIKEGLIEFLDKDLLRYYTTNDKFIMTIFIEKHKFKISSSLYTLLEQYYNLELHSTTYRVTIF